MDKDAKSFFEKLSGVSRIVNEDDTEEEKVKTRVLEEDAGEGDEGGEDEKEEEEENESLADFFEEAEGQLTVDVYETPTHFIVKSAVAGVDEQNLDIALTNESVTIRGSRKEEDRVKDQKYHVQECYWGRFARSIILPQEIDPDKATASLKNGILKISLPKVNKAKTKKLKVKFE
ncbi:Hsp20/alpha crystallin family protein [Candidatus Wolfebacteria bacterium]|nr:Hsp20/alpha crystallin family protein [Candidatus Wolfebacteria bacterium]